MQVLDWDGDEPTSLLDSMESEGAWDDDLELTPSMLAEIVEASERDVAADGLVRAPIRVEVSPHTFPPGAVVVVG